MMVVQHLNDIHFCRNLLNPRCLQFSVFIGLLKLHYSINSLVFNYNTKYKHCYDSTQM
jgi:hypothetical protein